MLVISRLFCGTLNLPVTLISLFTEWRLIHSCVLNPGSWCIFWLFLSVLPMLWILLPLKQKQPVCQERKEENLGLWLLFRDQNMRENLLHRFLFWSERRQETSLVVKDFMGLGDRWQRVIGCLISVRIMVGSFSYWKVFQELNWKYLSTFLS